MADMHAALVTSYDEPPHYRTVPEPAPRGEDETVVEVLAAGLHPRVRSGAAGQHYSSSGTLPFVPGVDAVGRRGDGSLVYFVADDDAGTMAERAVLDARRAVPLPDGVDVVRTAAAMNPAMAAWISLRRRVALQPGQSVLVLGATGNAGAMAVQLAKFLGAAHVVGAGRNRARLDVLNELGADEVVSLGEDAEATARALGEAAGEVDVVLDYLWGPPARQALMAVLTARADRSRVLDWVQIGALAAPTIELPSVALRSANLRLQGTGQGAVSAAGYLAELPSLVDALEAGVLRVDALSRPLADVEAVWGEPSTPGRRVVLVP